MFKRWLAFILIDKEVNGMMRGRRVLAIILIIGFFATLSGCCGGSTTVEKQPVVIGGPSSGTSPTVGQELQSLEEAYKKGVINKQQYEDAKKKLLENVGK